MRGRSSEKSLRMRLGIFGFGFGIVVWGCSVGSARRGKSLRGMVIGVVEGYDGRESVLGLDEYGDT